ncbi:MAG TPA: hypothetical protein VEF34_06190 [Syntrophobacteraceae bacterium]|nr:hypothetical protein [Syntrophobacteraceae bacterium]
MTGAKAILKDWKQNALFACMLVGTLISFLGTAAAQTNYASLADQWTEYVFQEPPSCYVNEIGNIDTCFRWEVFGRGPFGKKYSCDASSYDLVADAESTIQEYFGLHGGCGGYFKTELGLDSKKHLVSKPPQAGACVDWNEFGDAMIPLCGFYSRPNHDGTCSGGCLLLLVSKPAKPLPVPGEPDSYLTPLLLEP